MVVYLLHLVFWGLLQKKALVFHNLSALTLSALFLLIQMVWTVIMAFEAATISIITAVLVNILLVIIHVLAIVLALIPNDHWVIGQKNII